MRRRRPPRAPACAIPVSAVALVASLVVAATAGATAGVRLDGGTLVVTSAPVTGSDGDHTMVVEPFAPTSPTGVRVRQFLPGFATLFSSEANCRTNFVVNDVVCDGDDSVFLIEQPPNGQTTCVERPPSAGTFTVALGPGADRVDVVDGGPGADRISPGTGTDSLAGGDGDDVFCCASSGAATIRGNAGTDTVSYSPTTAPVAVTIADPSNTDGLVGITRDDVTGTVENVITGDGPDAVVGDGDRNVITTQGGGDTLRGQGGRDTLEAGAANDNAGGGDGDDLLDGGDGNDVLVGEGGIDTFSGGPGDDTLDARDGARDGAIACGPGNDVAVVDLRDTLTFTVLRDCEFIDRTAVHDGPPAAAIGRRLRVAADGSAVVPVSCPRGARARVAISLTRVARAGTRLLLQTRERGISRLGLRGSTRQVTVVR